MNALQIAGRHMGKVDAVVGPARALAQDTSIPRDARAVLFHLLVIEIALLANTLPERALPVQAAADAAAGDLH